MNDDSSDDIKLEESLKKERDRELEGNRPTSWKQIGSLYGITSWVSKCECITALGMGCGIQGVPSNFSV
jgi:hypothetical protein